MRLRISAESKACLLIVEWASKVSMMAFDQLVRKIGRVRELLLRVVERPALRASLTPAASL